MLSRICNNYDDVLFVRRNVLAEWQDCIVKVSKNMLMQEVTILKPHNDRRVSSVGEYYDYALRMHSLLVLVSRLYIATRRIIGE